MKAKKPYSIERHKFFSTEERRKLVQVTEAHALLDQAKGRYTWQVRWMLVHLALHSGLRVSEISNLQLTDVHLTKGSEYLYVRHGKRGKSRDVYIDQKLAEHLREFIAEKPMWFHPHTPTDYLLTGRNGKYTPTALTISFDQARQRAGLRKGLSIHSARHTFATLLFKSTGNLKFVQKQLGHASLNMTSLYADILPEENHKLANKILDDE